MISNGATCANTVGPSQNWQIGMSEAIDMLEARQATSTTPAHPPAVFQSAEDYGEETTELEIACRLLGDSCTYELKTTINNRKQMLQKMQDAINAK